MRLLDKLRALRLKHVNLLIEHNGVIELKKNAIDDGKTVNYKEFKWIKQSPNYYIKQGFLLKPTYLVSTSSASTISLSHNPSSGSNAQGSNPSDITPQLLQKLVEENFKQSVGIMLEEARKIPLSYVIMCVFTGMALTYIIRMVLIAFKIYVP